MSETAAGAGLAASGPGAVQVLLDLRDRWSERGVDWWSDDPTGRPGIGWVTVAELASDHDLVAEVVGAWAASHRIDDRKAAASLLVKRLGSILAFPPTVAWMRWRRVPSITPDGTSLRFVDGSPVRLAVPEPHAVVLTDDPIATADDVSVADEPELLEHLRRSAYEATMGMLIDAFNAVERTGRRHLWGNLGLTAVNSALWSAPAASPWDDGLRLLASDERLARTIEAIDVERADTGRFVVALRRNCCLAYADDDHGFCASCSLLDRSERIDDLTTRIGDAWRNHG